MRVCRGDVVLVDYPYSDRTGSKVRPCLVVQSDHNNHRLDDTIVVTISRTLHRSVEPTQVLVEIGTTEGMRSGLLFDSTIQCENILTIDCSFIHRKIGTLPRNLRQIVDDALKTALALS